MTTRLSLGIITLAIVVLVGSAPCKAADALLEAAVTTAQKAIEQQQYRKAETALKKGLSQSGDINDVGVARASVLLAKIQRSSGKVSDASQSLERARSIYKNLGHVEPDYADEFKALAGCYRIVDLAVLGAGSTALRTNAAKLSMEKTADGGAKIEILMDSPYQNSLNSSKIDGLQLEKSVTFEILQNSPHDIRVSNIKGFKIHSVEKNMWVNLLSLRAGAAESDGTYDAEITAGKAGVTKTVPSKLPQKAYEPLAGIAAQLGLFNSPVELDMPVVSVPVPEETATNPSALASPSAAAPEGASNPAPTAAPAVADPPVSNNPAVPYNEPADPKQQVKSHTTEPGGLNPRAGIIILEKKTRVGALPEITPEVKQTVKDAATYGEVKGSYVHSVDQNSEFTGAHEDVTPETRGAVDNVERRDTAGLEDHSGVNRTEEKSRIKRDRDDDKDDDKDDDDDDDDRKDKRD